MLDLSAATLAEITCLDRIRVHGVLGIVSLGADFLTVYFRWEPSEIGGVIVLRKSPVLVIERPVCSVMSPTGTFWPVLQMQRQVRQGATVTAMHN